MDLEFSGDEREFRREVRRFCETEIPAAIRSKVLDGRQLTRDEILSSHRILAKRGWSVPFWPVEWGGTGWSPIKYLIYREEMQAAGVPEPVPGNTYKLGPVLLEFGSAAQKEYFLPRLRNGDVYFCQGYSEPGAGSDLASLKMTATRARDADGEHYRLNGQKMWTSEAQHADWIFVITGSMGRRCGPRRRSTPTGSSCWPEARPARSARRASRSCSST
jgi:alkylation response protein AidB-like acyl-CoA dehydrogenase